MSSSTITTLVLIAIAAVLAPVGAEMLRRFSVPDVVLEIAFGILIGPGVLALAHPNDLVDALSDLGLAFLMFLAGFELDLARIKGRPLVRATIGWVMSVGLALVFAFVMVAEGFALDTLVIGLALTTTALGTLLPVLRDVGALETDSGPYILGIGTVGEFGPIVAVAVLLAKGNPFATTGLLVLFVGIAVVTALIATRPQPPRLVDLMSKNLNSSAQLPVRASVLLILLLVWLAAELGLDVLLGAFSAGIVVRLLSRGEDEEIIRVKLEAIGFGLLIPIFFIVSGMKFDVHSFVEDPMTLLRIPLFLVLFLVVRGIPALLLYRHEHPPIQRAPLAFFSATALPLVVVITTIGVSTGRMRPSNAAALVGAGMLSVLIYPVLGLRLMSDDGVDLSESPPEDERLDDPYEDDGL